MVDVFFPLPEGWGLCSTCEMFLAQAELVESPGQSGLEDYPPEYRQEFHRLSALVLSLSERYFEQVRIRIWDPRSLQGLLKSIRHGIRHYPAFVLDGQEKLTGWDQAKLEQHIQAAVKIGNSAI